MAHVDTTHAPPAHEPSAHPPEHEEETTTGINHRKLLMWVFLGSDCLFFGSLIATYMVYRGQSVVGPYPKDIIDVPITTISTFVLLMSSFAMVMGVAAARNGNQKRLVQWLIATIILGAIFIGFQVYEFNLFRIEGLRYETNLFSSTFFTLTGFHGAHVTLGLFWLLCLTIIAMRNPAGRPSGLDVDIAGLYWHFVDIVWIVIFTLLYLIGGFDAGPEVEHAAVQGWQWITATIM
ncbi:MAG: cytochrome c oxidase subunit 3 [Chloroflexi bacterium]|nr:cytochrome c oxidase subunit 3 [Chloroflexota bacterium]